MIFEKNAIAAFSAIILSAAISAQAADTKPNVLIFVADDLGYADMGFKGSQIQTPNLDRLAGEGAVLNRFYTAPICSPTRAALMTGRDPGTLGVAYSVILPWDTGGVHTDEHFMPESFQQAGYQTAMVGKWHLGHSQQVFHPNERGFDSFYGHLHTEVGFYPPFANLGGIDFQRNGKTIDDQGYETFLLADEASRWIEQRDKTRPFFMYLPFLAPHEPLEAPDEFVEKYKDLEDQREPARSPSSDMSAFGHILPSRRPLYAAVVDAMDQSIGQVLDTLDSENIADNTIVLFFSDNGATRVDGRGGGDNAPLRGGKAESYEGGIRVAALARWPQHIAAGSEIDEMITVMDVFPTLAAATGIKAQNKKTFDGYNALKTLTEDQPVERDNIVIFGSEIPLYGSFNFAAIEGDWKLVQWVEQDLYQITVKNELYNLSNDIGEWNDLSDKHPEQVKRMTEAIAQWRANYPINGTRARIAAPPGWHPPLDWSTFPQPLNELQEEPAHSMAPNKPILYMLDQKQGDRGRLVYDCQRLSLLGNVCNPLSP
ncbi:Arylsulfatase [Sinobacterium norvegicum]|uniref:Arylsulfatase n=1 Tax=Sinobacterium norvegicum TaxID=1641715 RepID=A0ABN8EK26_9GAMM|nr:sulfatase-like hydrolase/transferase [Sinobacterium norvegicum]CAH0992033.1 Arylsulfatase [Sinobacterium norvegicum]